MIDFTKELTFNLQPTKLEEGYEAVEMMLVDGEEVVFAFTTVRDKVVITNKRLITVNVQGVTGKKKDFTSLPFKKVQAFSVETAGTFEFDSELVLWFSGIGTVRLEIAGGFDIRAFNKVLSGYIL